MSIIKAITGGDGGDDKQKYVTKEGIDDLGKPKEDEFGMGMARGPALGIPSLGVNSQMNKFRKPPFGF